MIGNFEDVAYDFSEPTRPRHFYMIAATPRSGGTFLSQCLWRTGVMGAPHEYFNYYTTMLRGIRRLQTDSLHDYVTKLTEKRTTANGVFGFKAHYDHLQFMLLSGTINRMRKLAVISIERQDHLAQAVSHARALQTDQWNSLYETASQQPEYDQKLIRWCLDHLSMQRRGWQEFFNQHKVSPYRVDYDAFVSDPDGTVRRLLDQTGFPRAPVTPVSLPDMQRQADSLSTQWMERFKLDESAGARSG